MIGNYSLCVLDLVFFKLYITLWKYLRLVESSKSLFYFLHTCIQWFQGTLKSVWWWSWWFGVAQAMPSVNLLKVFVVLYRRQFYFLFTLQYTVRLEEQPLMSDENNMFKLKLKSFYIKNVRDLSNIKPVCFNSLCDTVYWKGKSSKDSLSLMTRCTKIGYCIIFTLNHTYLF